VRSMPPGTDMRSRLASRGATVREVIALFRRRWWIVVACVVLIPAAVYAYSAQLPKTYEASVVVQPDPTATTVESGDKPQTDAFVGTLHGYAGLGQVAGATARLVHRGVVSELTATLDTDTGWLTLTATAPTPRLAVDTANAYAAALAEYARHEGRRDLDRQIVGVQQSLPLTRDPVQRRDIRDTLASLEIIRDATTRPLHIVAPTSASRASPHPARNAILALILAVLIAPALVILVDRQDRKVRRPAELERLSGTSLLASIPKQAFASPGEPAARRAFQRLRDSVIFFDPDRRPTSVAIASPLAAEGRTTVAVGLATSFARSGRRVVLVDGDLRAPSVAARMGMLATPGLSDVLAGHDLGAALRRVDGFEGELTVLPGGSPSGQPAELLGSEAMSRLLASLSDDFDFVVIDTPPLLVTSGGLALVSRASGMVGVARLNHTPRDAVRRMMPLVAGADARVLGVVATEARLERGDVGSTEELDPHGRGPSAHREPAAV
jgi:succinoglycan biosynthesis transport protein ExoP